MFVIPEAFSNLAVGFIGSVINKYYDHFLEMRKETIRSKNSIEQIKAGIEANKEQNRSTEVQTNAVLNADKSKHEIETNKEQYKISVNHSYKMGKGFFEDSSIATLLNNFKDNVKIASIALFLMIGTYSVHRLTISLLTTILTISLACKAKDITEITRILETLLGFWMG